MRYFLKLLFLSTALNAYTIPHKITLKASHPQQNSQQILVVAPHPDDDVIGCGGSIAKHVLNGNIVSIIYMTSGEAALPSTTHATTREHEAITAARILNAHSVYFLRNPDTKLACNETTIETMKQIITSIRPSIIYIPHALDAHRDHKTTHAIVTATLAQINDYTPIIMCYEIWTPLQRPTHHENITDFVTKKLTALRKHASQIQLFRYDDAIEGLNRYRGVTHRCGTYAESFLKYRHNSINIDAHTTQQSQ